MSDKTLEEVSIDEFLAHFPPDRIVIPIEWSQIGMAIKNARFDGWNACLARMAPIIEQRERERLQYERLIMALKRIEQFGHGAGHGCGYSCANIAKEALHGRITGKLEGGK